MRVHSHTDPPDAIFAYQPWLAEIDGQWRQLDAKPLGGKGAALRVRVDGVADRDQAMLWRGRKIAVKGSSLPATDRRKGEYYWHDLIGLEVFCKHSGALLGKVAEIMETGANDVLRVVGEEERLLPWNYGETVLSVDLSAGRMVVDWQEPA